MYIFPRLPQVRLSQLTNAGVDVSGKTILYYGGARGNLLSDGVEKNVIDPKDYVSMDVDINNLVTLKNIHPSAITVPYDRYNPVYNPRGIKFKRFPQPDNTFDIVYSYSVNTHSSWQDYVFDISEMIRVSKGVVYTSIMNRSCMRTIHKKREADYGWVVSFSKLTDTKTGLYFINNDTILNLDDDIPHEVDLMITYYQPEWLISEISKMGLQAKVLDNPPPGIQPLLEIKDN